MPSTPTDTQRLEELIAHQTEVLETLVGLTRRMVEAEEERIAMDALPPGPRRQRAAERARLRGPAAQPAR